MTSNFEPLFPDDISDEAASVLSNFLYSLAMACESRYFIQLQRHDDRRQQAYDPGQPWKKRTGK